MAIQLILGVKVIERRERGGDSRLRIFNTHRLWIENIKKKAPDVLLI
jgi:hypothetical protein